MEDNPQISQIHADMFVEAVVPTACLIYLGARRGERRYNARPLISQSPDQRFSRKVHSGPQGLPRLPCWRCVLCVRGAKSSALIPQLSLSVRRRNDSKQSVTGEVNGIDTGSEE
jgi:hypothetical protein